CLRLRHPRPGAHLPPDRAARPPRRGEGVMAMAAAPAQRLPWAEWMKDAALVTLALAIPIVGLQAIEVNATLTIRPRFGAVAIGVAVVFLGRLALRAALAAGPAWRMPLARLWAPAGRLLASNAATLGIAIIVLAIALPFLPFASRSTVTIATRVLTYVLLGWGLNVVVGLAGLLDLGYVAFYAVGAYSFALFAQWFGLSFWAALPIAGLLAAAFGFVLGFPVLRLRGDYLAIVTLGFGEIIHTVLQNWVPVTKGPAGIGDVPAPTFFGLPFQNR